METFLDNILEIDFNKPIKSKFEKYYHSKNCRCEKCRFKKYAESNSDFESSNYNETVAWYQTILKYAAGESSLNANGNYGDNTKQALIRFQANYNLDITGNLTPESNYALTQIALQHIFGRIFNNPIGKKRDELTNKIKEFQRLQDITQTGTVGVKTRAAMVQVLSSGNNNNSSNINPLNGSILPIFSNDSEYSAIQKNKDLIYFKMPFQMQNNLRGIGINVQNIENGYGDLNLDFYSVEIEKMPNFNGESVTPMQLLNFIRININNFVDTRLSEFSPFKNFENKWISLNPTGSVIDIDIMGPDNAAVVVSKFNANSWVFSTVETLQTGNHPISGNREFGIINFAGKYLFYTRAADRFTSYFEEIVNFYGDGTIFDNQDSLWRSLCSKVSSYINSNYGKSTVNPKVVKHIDWDRALHLLNS